MQISEEMVMRLEDDLKILGIVLVTTSIFVASVVLSVKIYSYLISQNVKQECLK
jgi:hypothetical protein